MASLTSMDDARRLRILLAGDADGLGRLARSLRDEGHEVVLLGPVGSTEVVEAVALQEDVDATCVWDGGGLRVTSADEAVGSAIEALVEG